MDRIDTTHIVIQHTHFTILDTYEQIIKKKKTNTISWVHELFNTYSEVISNS